MNCQRIDSLRQQLQLIGARALDLREDVNRLGYLQADGGSASKAVFALSMLDLVQVLIRQAGQELGFAPDSLSGPWTEGLKERLLVHFEDKSNTAGTARQAVFEGNVAAAQRMCSLAVESLNRAQRVLDCEEDLSGQPLFHGALWDK